MDGRSITPARRLDAAPPRATRELDPSDDHRQTFDQREELDRGRTRQTSRPSTTHNPRGRSDVDQVTPDDQPRLKIDNHRCANYRLARLQAKSDDGLAEDSRSLWTRRTRSSALRSTPAFRLGSRACPFPFHPSRGRTHPAPPTLTTLPTSSRRSFRSTTAGHPHSAS